MSLARGKFGIEYNPRQMEREPSGLRWVFVVVAVVALISFSWTLVKRHLARSDEMVSEPTVEAVPSVAVSNAVPTVEPMPAPSEPAIAKSTYACRPTKVRNLLMRLEEAEHAHDVEMAVSTIETIRALPGSPAADIDDALARRLGALNIRRLFDMRNAQWVKQVTVKRGDSVSRLAAENGSTMASLVRLNGGAVDRILIGAKLYVMDHPRFNLVLHRRTRTADLSLNGKFFRRYDLQGEVRAKEGAYELPEKKRQFWTNIGARFKDGDCLELETLLPVRTPVLISEL